MILDPAAAAHFIGAYKKLLLAIDGDVDPDCPSNEQLVAARQKLKAAPSLLRPALDRMRQRNDPVADDVAEAVAGMQVRQWLYLRDTRTHSIFVDPEAEVAYGVLGLTQRLKQLTGDSGVSIQTALLPYRGHVICDGLIAKPVWLGASYRRSFNELLVEIRATGRFRIDGLEEPGPPALPVPVPMSQVASPVPAARRATSTLACASAVRRTRKDSLREERISMEIVVDAYNETERAMSWYCYLDELLVGPFDATCIIRRATSPLKVGQVVNVLGMAPDDECMSEMMVRVVHDDDELAVPLSQLMPSMKTGPVLDAVKDWHYWVEQGYRF